VVDAKEALLPIDVKATARPRVEDARHLETVREEYRGKARAALLLHTGERAEWLAPAFWRPPGGW